MSVEREFLQKANVFAVKARELMGLSKDSPICPFEYTQERGFPVLKLKKLMKENPKLSSLLLGTENRKPTFSAATLLDLKTGLIIGFIVNDNHHHVRQKSNLAHEWGHIFMGHTPRSLNIPKGTLHSKREEAEADSVGFAMLMSEEMCVAVAKSGLTDEEIAEKYHLSLPVVRLRMNRTYARKKALKSVAA